MSEEMMNGMMEKNEQRGCEMENGVIICKHETIIDNIWLLLIVRKSDLYTIIMFPGKAFELYDWMKQNNSDVLDEFNLLTDNHLFIDVISHVDSETTYRCLVNKEHLSVEMIKNRHERLLQLAVQLDDLSNLFKKSRSAFGCYKNEEIDKIVKKYLNEQLPEKYKKFYSEMIPSYLFNMRRLKFEKIEDMGERLRIISSLDEIGKTATQLFFQDMTSEYIDMLGPFIMLRKPAGECIKESIGCRDSRIDKILEMLRENVKYLNMTLNVWKEEMQCPKDIIRVLKKVIKLYRYHIEIETRVRYLKDINYKDIESLSLKYSNTVWCKYVNELITLMDKLK